MIWEIWFLCRIVSYKEKRLFNTVHHHVHSADVSISSRIDSGWALAGSTLPRVTSLLMRRCDGRPASVIITRVHTATDCCSGSFTQHDEQDDEDEDDEVEVETSREVLQFTSLITFNTSFTPTFLTAPPAAAAAAVWRFDGLAAPTHKPETHSLEHNTSDRNTVVTIYCYHNHCTALFDFLRLQMHFKPFKIYEYVCSTDSQNNLCMQHTHSLECMPPAKTKLLHFWKLFK